MIESSLITLLLSLLSFTGAQERLSRTSVSFPESPLSSSALLHVRPPKRREYSPMRQYVLSSGANERYRGNFRVIETTPKPMLYSRFNHFATRSRRPLYMGGQHSAEKKHVIQWPIVATAPIIPPRRSQLGPGRSISSSRANVNKRLKERHSLPDHFTIDKPDYHKHVDISVSVEDVSIDDDHLHVIHQQQQQRHRHRVREGSRLNVKKNKQQPRTATTFKFSQHRRITNKDSIAEEPDYMRIPRSQLVVTFLNEKEPSPPPTILVDNDGRYKSEVSNRLRSANTWNSYSSGSGSRGSSYAYHQSYPFMGLWNRPSSLLFGGGRRRILMDDPEEWKISERKVPLEIKKSIGNSEIQPRQILPDIPTTAMTPHVVGSDKIKSGKSLVYSDDHRLILSPEEILSCDGMHWQVPQSAFACCGQAVYRKQVENCNIANGRHRVVKTAENPNNLVPAAAAAMPGKAQATQEVICQGRRYMVTSYNANSHSCCGSEVMFWPTENCIDGSIWPPRIEKTSSPDTTNNVVIEKSPPIRISTLKICDGEEYWIKPVDRPFVGCCHTSLIDIRHETCTKEPADVINKWPLIKLEDNNRLSTCPSGFICCSGFAPVAVDNGNSASMKCCPGVGPVSTSLPECPPFYPTA